MKIVRHFHRCCPVQRVQLLVPTVTNMMPLSSHHLRIPSSHPVAFSAIDINHQFEFTFYTSSCHIKGKIHIKLKPIFTCVPLNTKIKLDPIAVKPHVNKVPNSVCTTGLKFGNMTNISYFGGRLRTFVRRMRRNRLNSSEIRIKMSDGVGETYTRKTYLIVILSGEKHTPCLCVYKI